jgi:hypothetical protein
MAQATKYPVTDRVRAPERERSAHQALRAYSIFVMVSALAYSWWFNLLGAAGAAILVGGIIVATLAIWIPSLVRRSAARRLRWERLPWIVLVYVALAFFSTLWSAWPAASIMTAGVLAGFTMQGIFFADMLSWSDIVRCLEVALRWIVGGSFVFEAWVALVVRHPIMPNFFATEYEGAPDPHWYWVRGNIFDSFLVGDRIQGVVGNSNLLGMLMLLAIIVFAVRLRVGVKGRVTVTKIVERSLWVALAAWMFVRAGSATTFVGLAVVASVAVVALVVRRSRRARGRRTAYLVFSAVAVAAIAVGVATFDRIAGLLGRSSGLTGRNDIWAAVVERAAERPLFGNGFSSPWVPWDPAFDGWIVDHDITVFEAHNMWLDAFLQLGALGVVVLAFVYGSAVWRAWFFAVDAPRLDAGGPSPFSPLSLVPLLILWALLTQGLTESNPMMLWGWMLVTTFVAKLRFTPAVTFPDRDAEIGSPV